MYSSRVKNKIIHVIILIVILFVILSVGGIMLLRYQVVGESNMPFKVTKISIIESVEGIEKENTTNKWDFDVNENNDIYIYVEKNSGYGKTEVIENVTVKNFNIEKTNEKGSAKILKPDDTAEKRIFSNKEENESTEIVYQGDLQSNIKEQKISNQGGKIAFRYAISNISEYISNEDEEIDHSKLLKLTNIQTEDLQTKLSFDIIIKLISGKIYQATVNLEIPSDKIIEEGTVGIENIDLSNIIFKRVENL